MLIVLVPLTRWFKGQCVATVSGKGVTVAMAGETVVVNILDGGLPSGVAPSQFWWNNGPVQWSFWFQFRSNPSLTQLVMPIWPLAVIACIGALLLWRGELPERRGRLGLCIKCGYDRRGIGTNAACPECGAKV
jgi:hypothetical protein